MYRRVIRAPSLRENCGHKSLPLSRLSILKCMRKLGAVYMRRFAVDAQLLRRNDRRGAFHEVHGTAFFFSSITSCKSAGIEMEYSPAMSRRNIALVLL